MDGKINYTLIGIFVFGLGLCLAVFLLWMAKYGFEQSHYDHYQIQMTDGVSGLNIESPVKFRGVKVGVVDKIYINPDNSELIDVLVSIEPGTPVKEDSIAILTAQGITGLSYIELKGGSKEARRLANGATIKAGQSLFNKLEQTVTDISQQLIQSMQRIDKLLSRENINALRNLLANLESSSQQFTEQLPLLLNKKNTQAIATTLTNSAHFSQLMVENDDNIQHLITNALITEQQAISTLKGISNTSQSLNKILATIDNKFSSGEYDIRQMTEPHLEAFDKLLIELELLSDQANEVLRQLKESPSDLLFKQQQYQRGPGE